MEAAALVVGIYALSLGLHVALPARQVVGYACDNAGGVLEYRLNGVVVLLLESAAFWFLLPKEQQVLLYDNYGAVVATANVLGLLASYYFVTWPQVPGGEEPYQRAVTRDQVDKNTGQVKLTAGVTLADKTKKKPWALVFFLGRDWNPRLRGVDVKMWLYLVGAVGLQCNILSCLAHQREAWGGHTSTAMLVYVFAFAWFLVEYMLGEEVHLYTYDLFAERIGFKLTWGCLVFYPTFYCVGAFNIASAAPGTDLTNVQAILTLVLFFSGWAITRGANMQKFFFRTQPECKTFLFGLVRQETIPGTRILVSGWWGVARHFNYFGEIVQALALAIPGVVVGPAGSYLRFVPLIYPLYYVALFVPRQLDDDALCEDKYKEGWKKYVKLVPYRIIPRVY